MKKKTKLELKISSFLQIDIFSFDEASVLFLDSWLHVI